MSQTYDPTLPASGVTTFGELYQILRDKSEALRSFFEGTSFPPNPVVGQGCYRSDLKKFFIYTGDATLGINGWIEVFIEITGHGLDVVTAAGTKNSLTERLAVSLNDDGTLKSTVAAYQSEWIEPSLTFTYVNANTFDVSGDQTDIYVKYRRVKFNHTTSATTYSTVAAATYSTASGNTTVTVEDSVIASDLTSVSYGIITADRTRDSLPRNIATTDLTNVESASVVTNLIADEAVTSNKAEKGYIPAGDFISSSFVVSGFDASLSTANPDTFYVSTGVAILKQSNGSAYRVEHTDTSFVTTTSGTTYYLDLNSDGTWSWSTIHSTDPNAIYMYEVIVNTSGTITSYNDTRPYVGIEFVRNSTQTQVCSPLNVNLSNGIVLGMDAHLAFNKHLAIRDNTGTLSLRSNWNSDNTYIISTAAAKISLNTDALSTGNIKLAVAPSGTAGDAITSKVLYIDSNGTFTWDGANVFTTANNPISKLGTGYQKLESGWIIQWGHYGGGVNGPTITFPIAFPTACVSVSATIDNGLNGNVEAVDVTSVTTTSFVGRQLNYTGAVTSAFYWIAIGY